MLKSSLITSKCTLARILRTWGAILCAPGTNLRARVAILCALGTNLRARGAILRAGAVTVIGVAILLAASQQSAHAASKTVDLNADGTAESPVSLTVVTTYPVKIQNKITNKAVGRAFTFRWPSAGPGGLSSSLGLGTSTGVGTIWTWQTTQQVYSFTGSTCTNDICFTQTGTSTTRGAFGVPGRSLTSSGVTLTSESLTSSLLTFFSPPALLFEYTSKIDQLAPGVFRYITLVDNHTDDPLTISEAPRPLGCNSFCGYNGREGTEVCDGSDLGGQTCVTQGGTGGTLGCQADCQHFDISQCTGICGNGVRELNEQCDGSDLGGDTCGTVGGDGSGTEVFNYSSFPNSLVCGTAACVITPNGSTLTTNNSLNRRVLRLTPSGLNKRGSAWYDTPQPVANGFSTTFQFQITDLSSGKHADGLAFVVQNVGTSALGGLAGSIGYGGIQRSLAVEFDTYKNAGSPTFDPNDNHIAVQSCGTLPNSPNHPPATGSCTIGAISTPGISFADRQVHTATIRYDPPAASCTVGCLGRLKVYLDNPTVPVLTTDVNLGMIGSSNAWVGLTAATGTYHEIHDVLSWSFTTFSSQGSLGCTPTCTFDLSQCVDLCGNGHVEPVEQCDGSDLGAHSCTDIGKGGATSCNANCQVDYSACADQYCGDHVVDTQDEVCDGSDLGGQTCVSQGGTGGTLGCQSDCRHFDLSQCAGICGNGLAEGSEQCDGTDLRGHSCALYGGGRGALVCSSECSLDTSGCDPGAPGGFPCETSPADSLPRTVDPGPTQISCTTASHPAKEVSSKLTICGGRIPGGPTTCTSTSEPATEGTAEILVPDLDVAIGPVFISPVAIKAVALGGGPGGAPIVPHPGDTVELYVSLLNAGSTPVSGVSATLTSPPADLDRDGTPETVLISQSTSSYPDGTCFSGFPGGSIDCSSTPTIPDPCTNLSPFIVTFPTNAPEDSARRFELSVSYAGSSFGATVFDAPFVVGVSGVVCGDGRVDGGEACDDGNTVDGDCCSSVCQFEEGSCDDGNACTTNDACSAGSCVGGPPPDCNDGNVCTDDACNPASGCTHMNNSAACDDGNACTTLDTCSSGACVGGPPPDCNDGNICTTDACNPVTGCTHTNNTAACDDGNACTTLDTCSSGACVGGPPPDCNDGNVCTDDACNPATGCTHTNNSAACNDGNACTTLDTCSAGTCVGGPPPNCDDGNICTTDACNSATGCTHTNNAASCDDGNACTTTDACSAGACVGGPPPNCNDANTCTTDACNSATGCTHTNNSAACNDGNACTTNDACSAGSCVGGAPPSCDDGDVCTADTCNPATGCAHQITCSTGQITPTGTTCDQFRTSTAPDLNLLSYGVKANKINSVSPGVYFYYGRITAPSTAFTVLVAQSHLPIPNPDWRALGVQQVVVYDAACVNNRVTATVTLNADGRGGVRINVSGATAGATYYLSVKYDPTVLANTQVSNQGGSYPTVTYKDQIAINGTSIASSQDGVAVAPR